MLSRSKFLALSAFFAVATVTAESPIVSLDYGKFLGVQDGNLTKFLGVPFAQPPARFERPKAPTPFQTLQNATTFGPTCPQRKLSPLPVPGANYTWISEDCLTLDVFTPAPRVDAKLPVLVWLYGASFSFSLLSQFTGGFEAGWSGDTDMRPTVEHSIALGEPVIIVVPNYRLSAWGFLSGKEASAAGVTNIGLRDQIFALEWVQQHISAFGGDPGRVIIGGLSAGAISTALLVVSNKQTTPDLFHGAFMVSGSPFAFHSQAVGQPYYDELVTATNCTSANDTLACLRAVPYDEFLAAVDTTPDIFSYQGFRFIWAPHVDGDVVVQNPAVSISQGAFAKIPILTGDSDDEGTIFAYTSTNVTTDAAFLDYVHDICLPGATSAQIAQVAALYPDDPTQGSPFGTGTANQLTPEFKRVAAFEGDWIFQGPRRFFLEHASSSQKTWSWCMQFPPSFSLNKRGKSTPYLGAFHGSDLSMFFPTNASAPTDNVAIDALINFINTLDPNLSAAPAHLRKNASIFWPTWQTPSADGASSLLTFSDPLIVNITADDFRAEPRMFLNQVALVTN
ncbi:carotenoid ester lipase precursor [Mycena galericulata]|nr:carotenoid ester lipase precursor [Mycena galericulata]